MHPAGFVVWSGIVIASLASACGSDGKGDGAAGASGAGGSASQLADSGPDTPAPPLRIPNVGGEISFEARGFIGAYCALFEPCCTVGGGVAGTGFGGSSGAASASLLSTGLGKLSDSPLSSE